MTENEAVEILKNNYPKTCKMVNGRYRGGFDNTECNFGQALTMAIKALKEIQQFREIGTIEELKCFKDMKVRLEKYHVNISVSRLLECFIETVFENTRHEGFIILTNQEAKDYETYCSIGTVEECREAVEKQKPKKPVKDKYHHNCCPNCGWIVSGEGGYGEEFCPHCENCGQAIQWDEDLEDIENGT